MTAEFLMDLAPIQHRKLTELMSPRAPSLTQVSPFHWAQQNFLHLRRMTLSRVQSGDSLSPYAFPVHVEAKEPPQRSETEKVQILSVLLLAVPCGIRHLLFNVPSTAFKV